jgi:hypothetical protein
MLRAIASALVLRFVGDSICCRMSCCCSARW